MEKMYSIQVGNKKHLISGASLSLDLPSYFTNYFSKPENENKTLFIDRSPVVFDLILLHLQGYYIDVKTPLEFVYLFLDVFYYNLPRLKKFLFLSDIFVNIGTKLFKFPRKTFELPGNHPNFFSVAFSTLFRDPSQLISNLDLLRPPPQAPIVVSNRCDFLFEQILRYAQGYDIKIELDAMRAKLVKECRYYRFFGLEQSLIKHTIVTSPFTLEEEITLNIEDVRQRGLRAGNAKLSICKLSTLEEPVILKYSRPYVDEDVLRTLILQINLGETFMIADKANDVVKLKFIKGTCKKVKELFEGFISDPVLRGSFKMIQSPTCQVSESMEVEALLDDLTHMVFNNEDVKKGWYVHVFCKQTNSNEVPCTLTKSQWKVKVGQGKFQLIGIKLHAVTCQYEWYKGQEFL